MDKLLYILKCFFIICYRFLLMSYYITHFPINFHFISLLFSCFYMYKMFQRVYNFL